jgi:hypothetical protein
MSNRRYNTHQDDLGKKESQWLSWRVKGPLFALALLMGLLSHALHNWGEPIFFAAIVLMLPVFYYRRFWDRRWFWLMVMILGAVQIPLVFAAHPLVEQARTYYTVLFTMADLMFVIVVTSLVCSKLGGEGRTEAWTPK